jgi:hypothetical protein
LILVILTNPIQDRSRIDTSGIIAKPEQYYQSNPKGPKLLGTSAVSPKLSPTDWGSLENLLVKLEESVSPMIES